MSTIWQVSDISSLYHYLKFGTNISNVQMMKLRLREVVNKLPDVSWLNE